MQAAGMLDGSVAGRQLRIGGFPEACGKQELREILEKHIKGEAGGIRSIVIRSDQDFLTDFSRGKGIAEGIPEGRGNRLRALFLPCVGLGIIYAASVVEGVSTFTNGRRGGFCLPDSDLAHVHAGSRT